MIRRLLLVALLVSLGIAAFTAMLASSGPLHPTSGGAELTDVRSTASVAQSPSGSIDAVLGERIERAGEVARTEPRQPSRQHRTPLWAVAAIVVSLMVLALARTIARRRAGRTAVRAGRVAPARAPPLSLACS